MTGMTNGRVPERIVIDELRPGEATDLRMPIAYTHEFYRIVPGGGLEPLPSDRVRVAVIDGVLSYVYTPESDE